MRKLLKFLGWTLGLALVTALAAFLALKFYFTPDRIRKLVVEYAGKNLGREISLDAAALDLRGFSIKNLNVAETGGFKKGDFLSAKEFSVRPNFRALLKKEFRINSIRASGV
ncbi:MAG: AsmA family protein, partial [Nitrospirota bacterium]